MLHAPPESDVSPLLPYLGRNRYGRRRHIVCTCGIILARMTNSDARSFDVVFDHWICLPDQAGGRKTAKETSFLTDSHTHGHVPA